MDGNKKADPLERAVHVIIVLLGIIVLRFAYDFKDVFWQSVLINIGSSLVIVTILFAIFEAFRRRYDDGDTRADQQVTILRASQTPSVTSNTSKTGKSS